MNGRRSLRTTLLRMWKLLPPPWQSLLIWLGSSRVSYGAGAIILDEQGRVLLLHHPYRRGTGWGLPGGVSAQGEQPEQTIVRELREELGVCATIERLVYAGIEPRGRHLSLTYLVRLSEEPRPDGIEIDEYRFVAPAELPPLLGPRAAARLCVTLDLCASEHNRHVPPRTAGAPHPDAVNAPAPARHRTDTTRDSSGNMHTG